VLLGSAPELLDPLLPERAAYGSAVQQTVLTHHAVGLLLVDQKRLLVLEPLRDFDVAVVNKLLLQMRCDQLDNLRLGPRLTPGIHGDRLWPYAHACLPSVRSRMCSQQHLHAATRLVYSIPL